MEFKNLLNELFVFIKDDLFDFHYKNKYSREQYDKELEIWYFDDKVQFEAGIPNEKDYFIISLKGLLKRYADYLTKLDPKIGNDYLRMKHIEEKLTS